jgi:hypothetical protein
MYDDPVIETYEDGRAEDHQRRSGGYPPVHPQDQQARS